MSNKTIVLGNLPLATKIIKKVNSSKRFELIGAIHPSREKTYDSPFGEQCAYKFCKQNGIEQIEISDVKSINNIDIGISARHNKILDKWFLDRFRLGVVNCHGGYLPEYKGVGGHVFPIINAESYTGASIHWMDERVDHGPIIDRKKINIEEHDTGISLYFKINTILFDLIKQNIKHITSENMHAKPQNEFTLPNSKYPKIKYKHDLNALLGKKNKTDREKRALFWPSK